MPSGLPVMARVLTFVLVLPPGHLVGDSLGGGFVYRVLLSVGEGQMIHLGRLDVILLLIDGKHPSLPT